MDMDEGNCTSRTLIDTTRRMAAEARGDSVATYAEVADPMLMFTTSDVAIADLVPQLKGEYPNTADAKPQSTTDEMFAPFDFDESFISQHGITPEEADMPASKQGTEPGTSQWGSSQASSVRSIPGDTVGHSESHPHGLATVLPHHCQPSSMEIVQTYGSCLHGQETIAGMGSYPRSTIQVDPQVLQDILTGQWAARELGGASYMTETYHHPPPKNPYLEIDPIPWQTPPPIV